MILDFHVVGEPAPQGSMKAFTNKNPGRAILPHNKPQQLKNCGLMCSTAAQESMKGRPPYRGPVYIRLEFMLKRPKGHYGTGRNADRLKDSAPGFPTGKPDLDKLVRGVCDALKDIVWADDSQVCQILAFKNYTVKQPGCKITVTSFS